MAQDSSPLIAQLKRFLAESLPTAARTHRHLADLRWGTGIDVEAFSNHLARELHHHTAVWGALQQVEAGDSSAWSSVGLNLARLLHRRKTTIEMAARLPQAVRQDHRGQLLISQINQGTQEMRRYLPNFLQIVSATGWTTAAPEFFPQQ